MNKKGDRLKYFLVGLFFCYLRVHKNRGVYAEDSGVHMEEP